MTRNLFLAALACGLCFTAVAQDLKLLREREEQLVAVSILVIVQVGQALGEELSGQPLKHLRR